MNIICNYKNNTFVKKTINNKLITTYIISLDNFSLFTENTYQINCIKDIVNNLKKYQKKVIIDVAKIVHEDELSDLEEKILFLNDCGVDYFMYSDFGVYYILKKNNLIDKTMLYSNTYLTNTLDTRIYQEKNKMVVLSNQINAEELIKISKDSCPNQVISAFGLALIMYTYRPLLSNYFTYRAQIYDAKKKNYALQEEFREDLYPIIENCNSTKIYDFGHYYLFDELKQMNDSCDIIVSGELLSDKVYFEILDLYTKYLTSLLNEEQCLEKLDVLNVKLNKGAYSRTLTLTKGGNQNA